uniref:transcription factor HES-4-B-like n=1 Tax=Styela clava TaxID=7725 RepID=UPI00193A9D4D|nr:transcription factor HES-4-B-like [Styela clava]
MKTIMAPHTPVVVSPNGHGIMKSDRRASKPMMEKRRRERINKSLNELKSILLDALRKDSTCHSKLEKADILEMTVRYLRSIQRQRITAAMALDPSVLNKYRTGYIECKSEVSKFLENSSENLRPDVKSRLMSHLGNTAGHPNLMAGNPHAQLMTTGAPMTAGTALQPMPIQLAPNTQMQAMAAAAAAAAMAGNVRNHGYFPGSHHHSSRTQAENRHRPYPVMSPTSPGHHSRHMSGSPSTGKCSPTYSSSSPPLSPPSNAQKFQPMSPQFSPETQQRFQGSFVFLPNAAQFSPEMQQVPCSPGSRSLSESPCSSQGGASPKVYRSESPESIYSMPSYMSPRKERHLSSEDQQPFIKKEPHSPPSPTGSDNSESVWRPW